MIVRHIMTIHRHEGSRQRLAPLHVSHRPMEQGQVGGGLARSSITFCYRFTHLPARASQLGLPPVSFYPPSTTLQLQLTPQAIYLDLSITYHYTSGTTVDGLEP